VILGDQKRIEVQPLARYRIVDPLLFYQALRTVEAARAQLGQLVGSVVRRELGQATLARLLTPERAAIVEAVRAQVRAEAEPLGLEIDEVLFHRADLPPETSQAIYDRMKSERQREAKELRAQGYEWAQQIQAKADHDRTVLMSQAQQAAAIARGEGDAEASRRVAAAYAVDPKFYEFYRAAQTYKTALARPQSTFVVSPDARFLGLMIKGPQGASAEAAK
jgi:membrane protease subunit HflC